MVRKKAKQIGLYVFHNELNSTEFVTDVLQRALGYHYTQAGNCANVIFHKGEYLVRVFDISEMEKAQIILQVITDQEIPAKLLPL